jgi:hypothetical protein
MTSKAKKVRCYKCRLLLLLISYVFRTQTYRFRSRIFYTKKIDKLVYKFFLLIPRLGRTLLTTGICSPIILIAEIRPRVPPPALPSIGKSSNAIISRTH